MDNNKFETFSALHKQSGLIIKYHNDVQDLLMNYSKLVCDKNKEEEETFLRESKILKDRIVRHVNSAANLNSYALALMGELVTLLLFMDYENKKDGIEEKSVEMFNENINRMLKLLISTEYFTQDKYENRNVALLSKTLVEIYNNDKSKMESIELIKELLG